MDSDSAHAVSSETANRHMSSDTLGPLSDKLDGTTPNAHVTSTCLPAEDRPNKTSIFNIDFSDTRAFLSWLRAFCPGGLTAQIKGEKWMVALSPTDGFRGVVSTILSIDGMEVWSFYNFTLPDDRCVRLLVKNLFRRMPRMDAREELETLNILVQGVSQRRSGRLELDPAKDPLPQPT